MDVHHSPGRLDQGILVLALPLNLPAHPAILYAVNRFPIPNGVIMLQYVRRRIIGVVHYPVGIHAMEVVLEVRQEQGVHAHCVDEHILGALNVEEADIDTKSDEAVRALDLVGTHIFRQQELAAAYQWPRPDTGTPERFALGPPGSPTSGS